MLESKVQCPGPVQCPKVQSSWPRTKLWTLDFSSRFLNFLDPALHVKVLFGNIVVLAFENLFKATHGIRHRHLFAFASGEHLRDGKRLTEETLNLSGAEDR